MQWKRWLRTALKRAGLEVSRAGPDVASFLRSRNVRTVLDVGANIGQYGEYLRSLGYREEIVSFEPVRDVFAILRERAGPDPKWKVHPVGLGAEDGEATINVSANPVFSSILATRGAASRFDARAAPGRTETITIHTLDRYVARCEAPIFIKIDTQGFERQVLAGCDLSNPDIVGIQLELPVIHLYAGTWSISEAIEHMAGKGFVISQLKPVNHHHMDRDALVEIDCVFRRRSELDE